LDHRILENPEVAGLPWGRQNVGRGGEKIGGPQCCRGSRTEYIRAWMATGKGGKGKEHYYRIVEFRKGRRKRRSLFNVGEGRVFK